MEEELRSREVYSVIFSDRRERDPIEMVYVGISPRERRVLNRIFLSRVNGEIRAYRAGEKYEVIGKTRIFERSSRINLTPADLRYIEEKKLLKDL